MRILACTCTIRTTRPYSTVMVAVVIVLIIMRGEWIRWFGLSLALLVGTTMPYLTYLALHDCGGPCIPIVHNFRHVELWSLILHILYDQVAITDACPHTAD